MELIKYSKAAFGKNELIIDESVTIDEWKELGQSLKQVEGSVQFWIGDWARFGDKKGFTGKYTDSKVYDELEEITGLDHGTLKNYKSVSENIPSSLRRDDLSFSHHAEAAKLPEAKQAEFLTRASEEKLSVRELREEIRQYDNNVKQAANNTIAELTTAGADRLEKRLKKSKDLQQVCRIHEQVRLEKELHKLVVAISTKYSKVEMETLIHHIQNTKKFKNGKD